jgi:hypothetical protein
MTAKQRRERWHEPNPREKEIRELNRLMREELSKAHEDDGEIAGPLAVVARYATPQLLEDLGLSEEHVYPFEHWLMAKLGDVLRDPDAAGYLAWRESCVGTIS